MTASPPQAASALQEVPTLAQLTAAYLRDFDREQLARRLDRRGDEHVVEFEIGPAGRGADGGGNPEVGVEEEPISPVSRDETVTKINPKTTMSSAPNKFQRRCSWGTAMMIAIMARPATAAPMIARFIPIS